MTQEKDWILHSVIFSLKHAPGSEEEQRFLQDARAELTAIPVVRNFKVYRQVSPKNEYDYGFAMEFANQADYEAYNDHPNHVRFVQERWVPEVEKFLEIDYKNE
ncbi:Dabb family protein [Paenibacillus xanthanilyticus]|uniref:Dabb family protein n=1 Tax=Paenibacillus xanthanilyticus TaxID=1783531 RepID=A0ABV8JY98_9BACL